MANITYRVSSTPSIPVASLVKGTPLTNLEVDANFKAISTDLDTKTTAAEVETQSLIMAIALG